MPRQNEDGPPCGRKPPTRSVTTRTSERHARRADRVREQALRDPATLALLDEAHRLRGGQECEWITFDDLDERYPAEA
jgi:hypothetical protein